MHVDLQLFHARVQVFNKSRKPSEVSVRSVLAFFAVQPTALWAPRQDRLLIDMAESLWTREDVRAHPLSRPACSGILLAYLHRRPLQHLLGTRPQIA